ncbi:unnamed protein product [Paramecium octaurelia]|uniref:Rab-GAP TBC domain-containing protein n=1 Tax=Paramecium octaurelia TaxID=43137 RepID=A0A8S1VIJ1_PAROT|nr:unnamed protein product [Paramecium octaurelia]
MNHSIDYYNKQQQKLYEYMVSLTQNVTGVEKIFQDLIKCLHAFSQEIKVVGEKMHTQISCGNEPDILVCLYQQVSNYLLRLSQNWESTAQKLKSEIAEPYTQFVLNFRQTNRTLNSESKKQVTEIWETRKELCKTQDEYWKIMKQFEQKSQQTQEMIDLIEKGSATREDFQKQFASSLKLQELVDESEKDYKKLLTITNEKWKSFHEEWDNIFANVGLNEQSRIMFTKQTVSSLLKLLPFDKDLTQIEEKVTDLEIKLKEDPKIPILKLIEKKMEIKDSRHQVIQLAFKFQFEEFISYEQWKKININSEYSVPIQQIQPQWQIVGDKILEDEKKFVDKYLTSLFTLDTTDKSEQLIKIKQILEKQSGRNYFINQLIQFHSKSIEEKQSSFYLTLSNEQFQEVTQLIRHWLNYIDLNNLYESEDLYDLLLKSIRIVRKEGRDRINLASQLSDIALWRKIEKWIELFQYINAKKVDEKRKQVELLKQQNQNNIVQKGFKMIGSIFRNSGANQQTQFELNESQICYMIMEEINLFLTSLKLSSDLSTEIIIQIAFQQPRFDKEHVKKLLEKQEDLHNTQWKKLFKSGKIVLTQKSEKYDRKNMEQYQNKVVQVFGAAMKYLTIDDQPWHLLLINRQFSMQLKNKIKKFYLANGQILFSEKTHQLRLKLIAQVLKLEQMKIDYVEMKTKVGLEMDINQLYEETIKLDVQRSLHLHKDKINSSVLQSLLRIYAFYHQEVGYCQGMNYIAGYLYLNFQDQEIAYKAFDRMMNLYFKDLYINDFSKLKIGFYQFDRLLQIFLPELSQHLKDQKIDPSYYVASWFITLYSNVFQYIQRSALLNIIWDIFLAEEWKGFFKTTFYLLWLLQQHLLNLEFDDILHYLGQLIKSEFFNIDNEKDLIKFIQKYDKTLKENESIKTTILQKFRISNRMLKNLDQEYHSFQTKLNQKLTQCLKK